MADPFVGEIRMFGFKYPPQDWAQCNGQVLQSRQAQVLYAVIGNNFGGTAPDTFQLPNLQGSAVCQAGAGTSLTPRTFAKTVGASAVSLSETQIPNHQHTFDCYVASTPAGTVNIPSSNAHLSRTLNQFDFTSTDTFDTTLSYQMVGQVGDNAVHENRQPFLVLNFCICLLGEYPVPSQ